ncbi:MAG: hemolysin family protein [Clostridia bacterium]|nr:hemolysin family protein [Clostridia bacterium]
MSIEICIPLIFVLLVLSAFFSGTEIAYTSVNVMRLESVAEKSRSAKIALSIHRKFDNALSSILIGNNLVNIMASSVATGLALSLMPDNPRGPLLASAVMTVLILIFGEIEPKIFAKRFSLWLTCFSAIPLKVLTVVLKPLSFPVVALVNLLFRRAEEPKVTEEELSDIIETVEAEGVIDEDKSDLLQSALDFSDTTMGEIITHRLECDAIDITLPLEEAVKVISGTSYTRLPVYEHNFDHVIGVLNVNHYYRQLALEGEVTDLRPLLQKPEFVYGTMKLPAALAEMREKQNHVDFVLDEYGGVSGIVTMEDILEQIVGEIWDESDEIEDDFVKTGDDVFEVNGSANIIDMFDLMDVDDRDFDSDCTTVGGWAIEMLDADPHEGDTFSYKNLYVIVTEMGENRINRLSVRVSDTKAEEEE